MSKVTPKTRKWIMGAVVLVLAISAGGIVLWSQMARAPYYDRLEPNAVVGAMPGKTPEQLQAELDGAVSEKSVAFTINSAPTFANGKEMGNILFENPSFNNKLTRVEISLDDTGEILYKSGLLEPGSYIPEAGLLISLDKGVYPCTAVIYAYRQDDESYIGKVAAGLSLTIEN